MYGTIAKVAVSGDTASFLLILSVMTSVSELIGFVVIRVFPHPPHSSSRIPLIPEDEGRKSDDALIANGESSREPTISDEETATLTGAPEQISPESISNKHTEGSKSALMQHDFWLIATIMAMCSFPHYLPDDSEWMWVDVY
jgi:hypothetical protein